MTDLQARRQTAIENTNRVLLALDNALAAAKPSTSSPQASPATPSTRRKRKPDEYQQMGPEKGRNIFECTSSFFTYLSWYQWEYSLWGYYNYPSTKGYPFYSKTTNFYWEPVVGPGNVDFSWPLQWLELTDLSLVSQPIPKRLSRFAEGKVRQ